MATMYITEYKEMPTFSYEAAQIPMEPALAVQAVTFTTTTASAVLNAETRFVSIQLSANGHIHFDPAAVATTSTSRLHEANAVSFHGVPRNQAYKIAAVAA